MSALVKNRHQQILSIKVSVVGFFDILRIQLSGFKIFNAAFQFETIGTITDGYVEVEITPIFMLQ